MTDAPAADGPKLLVLVTHFARQRRCPPPEPSTTQSQSATKPPPVPDGASAQHFHTLGASVLTRISGAFRSVIDWLRAGYPDEAPSTSYSPLLALNGPLALTPRQMRHVVDELRSVSADATDIKVAITKATDRLPTQTQIRAVTTALHPNHAPAAAADLDPDN
jgi:hypothetical protein